jgi:hypothetical protein
MVPTSRCDLIGRVLCLQYSDVAFPACYAIAIEPLKQRNHNPTAPANRLSEITGRCLSALTQEVAHDLCHTIETLRKHNDIIPQRRGFARFDEKLQRLLACFVRSQFFTRWWIARLGSQRRAQANSGTLQMQRQSWPMCSAANDRTSVDKISTTQVSHQVVKQIRSRKLRGE